MATQPAQRLTPEEYLKLERAAETKSEYLGGRVIPMSGATPRHILITTNVAAEIHRQLKGRPCRVFSRDLRVRVEEGEMYAFPDVVALCGKPEFEEGALDCLTNPTLIVEVVADSTGAYERGTKLACYRRCPSLQECVLVSQDWIGVERWFRRGEQWALTDANTLDEVIDLPSIGCSLALRDIYDKVEGLTADG